MPERGGRRAQAASLRICVTCRWRALDVMDDEAIPPGRRLFDIAKAIATPEQKDRIHEIVCLTHCPNACNAVAMQRGKTPLLMTRMAPDHDTACALLEILEKFGRSPTGEVASTEITIRPLVPTGLRGRR